MSITDKFDPQKDGWYFENWGEAPPYCLGSCDFTWDLYRKTYLGINPTHNCVEAPLDCAFYEIFRNCAEKGNCGGMSLLSLALFKYGGYMGFCSPACFYTGTKSPDRDDLHRAINILQARQFSAHGIENFLDVCDAGNLNNAVAAFERAKELLGMGDYPILSIAVDLLGHEAHTVIPYRIEEDLSGTKTMFIWDPNHPYDDDPSHYSGPDCRMVINSPTDWVYTSGQTTYNGSSGGWCFTIPMSLVLRKARHPMTLDMVFDALMTIFISGPGAAISQISDDEGHQFYRTEADRHVSRRDIETDPAKRLKGIGRWPWYGFAGEAELPGELYFLRGPLGKLSRLNLTVSGKKYKAVQFVAGNLVEIDVKSTARSKDVIRFSRSGTAGRSIEMETLGNKRNVTFRQLRIGVKGTEWRSCKVENITMERNVPVIMNMVGDLEAVQVSSGDKEVKFAIEMQRYFHGKISKRNIGTVTTTLGKTLRVSPRNWTSLSKTRIDKETLKPR
jgi:hypothetical protein